MDFEATLIGAPVTASEWMGCVWGLRSLDDYPAVSTLTVIGLPGGTIKGDSSEESYTAAPIFCPSQWSGVSRSLHIAIGAVRDQTGSISALSASEIGIELRWRDALASPGAWQSQSQIPIPCARPSTASSMDPGADAFTPPVEIVVSAGATSQVDSIQGAWVSVLPWNAAVKETQLPQVTAWIDYEWGTA